MAQVARTRKLRPLSTEGNGDEAPAQPPDPQFIKDELALYSGLPADPLERERQSLVNRALATVRSRTLKARDDPNEFIHYCFRDPLSGRYLEQQDFHRDMQDLMSDESVKNKVLELPRDHGKTTQLEGHAIWRLGNDPNKRIKIVCESDSKAVERLFAIIQHIRMNDRVRDVFPWLKPAALGDWTKHKIVVERDHIMRDASIEALGVLSTATGGRADILMADDAVGRRNSLEQPKLRETVKSAWDSDWTNLVEPGGEIMWISTPWHVADCTHKLEQSPAYKVMKRPVGVEGDPFHPLWAAKWGRDELMARRLAIGDMEYNRGFRLIALSGEFAVVAPEWITYWTEPPDVGALNVFIAFDVSSGVSKDFFACVVLGVDPKTLRIYVLEAWHAKLTFLERAGAVASQAVRWAPNMMGIEEETMKSLSQYIDETTLLLTTSLRPTLPKAVRLMGITPHLERGQVIFNPALDPQRIANPAEHGDVVGELTEFPLAANDDLVDAFVHCMTLATAYGLSSATERGAVNLNVGVLGSDGHGAPKGVRSKADIFTVA